MFNPPPSTLFTFLNLGAGVQSSCLALMAAKGEIDSMPDAAIFADTQAEPASVYQWLNWLEAQLPFPVIRVTRGSLTSESLRIHSRKKDASQYIRRLIPAFGIMPNGKVTAAIGRKCTADFKVSPIMKTVRELAGIKRGQKDITVTQWIGISRDELQRMREADKKLHPWTQHRWPLIELGMTRRHCLEWMKLNGYPEPPRSACSYCPFHSNDEWRRLRDDEPEEFAKAIEFEKEWQIQAAKDTGLKMKVFLHNSCKPLSEINFDSDEQKGQGVWDFSAECSGMCGV